MTHDDATPFSLHTTRSSEVWQDQVLYDVRRALEEDVGVGDVSADLVPLDQMATGRIVVRESAILCGQAWAEAAFLALDPDVRWQWLVGEGQRCQPDQVVLQIQGKARALLSAERTALNFLQTLSAVATKTASFVQAVAAVPRNRAVIVDTRKTLPGLRQAQKYAVLCGGGANHRMGLFDAILIKENHIAAAGGVTEALRAAQAIHRPIEFIEIEVETLEQLREALDAGARMILLDNMTMAQLVQAVSINAGRAVLEVSGGVNLDTVRAIAATGVDRISIGALTKDVKAVDFSMRLDAVQELDLAA